ncbi:bacteriocin production-related histidine kinase [Lactobacillus helveticus MTCC 5463]|nr:bacteriocin production-related histidine kinase [Lactobacillus helveticus MTCC 5463]
MNHLHNDALKSLVVNKLNEGSELSIKYSFECEKEIAVLPKNVKLFDLVQIIEIVFDNAIEESEQLEKTKQRSRSCFIKKKQANWNSKFYIDASRRLIPGK